MKGLKSAAGERSAAVAGAVAGGGEGGSASLGGRARSADGSGARMGGGAVEGERAPGNDCGTGAGVVAEERQGAGALLDQCAVARKAGLPANIEGTCVDRSAAWID